MHFIDSQLIDYLTEKAEKYCTNSFIDEDPIKIPHLFTSKEDIEIAGFFAAILAWGNRKMIVKNATSLVEQMDFSPAEFVQHASDEEIGSLLSFKHRTINGVDIVAMVRSLRSIYARYGGLERVFAEGFCREGTLYGALLHFRNVFTEGNFPDRTQKHIANVAKKSAAKRIAMYLRWMVRDTGPDFGLWPSIPKSALMLPLDVHTARVGRGLGLLQRKQNDWLAVEEITGSLRTICPNDPVKFDYALFGIGVFEKTFFDQKR